MSEDHAGCVLAIVGSRDCHQNATFIIQKALERHRPILVISGGAKVNASNAVAGRISIDQMAAFTAKQWGYPVHEFLPAKMNWAGEGGFMERNLKIAEACVCLVRISSTTTKTYGSGWTADQAEGLGKNVERYTVDTETGEAEVG